MYSDKENRWNCFLLLLLSFFIGLGVHTVGGWWKENWEWVWALYHFIWMPSNSRQKKICSNATPTKALSIPQIAQHSRVHPRRRKNRLNWAEPNIFPLEDSYSVVTAQLTPPKRWKFMMLINLSVCMCILQSTKKRRLEMKTANNRQQYPGFACLLSDNNFNLPTEYIHSYSHSHQSMCYCVMFVRILYKIPCLYQL